jgi:hypothetical protein
MFSKPEVLRPFVLDSFLKKLEKVCFINWKQQSLETYTQKASNKEAKAQIELWHQEGSTV